MSANQHFLHLSLQVERVLILISQRIMEACFHHWIKKLIIKKKVIATFYLTIAR